MNCFQNCTFTHDSQPTATDNFVALRCELLSKLYFYSWFPTLPKHFRYCTWLWIAFKIVLLLMIPNAIKNYRDMSLVVNCFQNCTFTHDSQLRRVTLAICTRCELLSKLYFYSWFPTDMRNYFGTLMLWIAFKIVLLLMIPN